MEQLSLFNDIDDIHGSTFKLLEDISRETIVHEFQAGVIYAYKNIPSRKKNVISITNDGFFVRDTFYDINTPKEKFTDILRTHDCLSLLQYKEFKPTKRVEVCYNLNDVFARKSYKNAKKYYKQVTRPFSLYERYNMHLRCLDENDIDIAKSFHDEWVKYKFDNYNVMRISFPIARYIRCLQSSIYPPHYGIKNIALFRDDVLLGFRCFYLNDNGVYDLAYITDRNSNIKELSEIFEIVTLDYIHKTFNCNFFNCGLSNGKLKKFKEHLPHIYNNYFSYKKQ